MAKDKKFRIEIKGEKTLHGKRARLVRGETEYNGILLSADKQVSSNNLMFQYKNNDGAKCISPVTKDEMENIEECLIDF